MTKTLGITGALASLLLVAGATVQRLNSIAPNEIALWIHASALVGVLTCAPSLVRDRGWTGWIVAYAGWRLAFFPVLVISGHAAAVFEWILRGIEQPPWTTYPTLFLGVALGTAISVRLLHAATATERWPHRSLLISPLIAAAMISFTAPADLHPLPDRTPWAKAPTPAVHLPRTNVYRRALDTSQPGTLRIPLLAAAAITYGSIPQTPWAARVQGTLEAAFVALPSGSSTDRIREHFQAIAAAHEALRDPK